MIGLFFLILLRQIIGYFGLGQEAVSTVHCGTFLGGNLQQCDLIEKMIKSSAASG